MSNSKSIVVEYLPAGEHSPFPDEFKQWVQGYVCVHCLVDYLEFRGKEPETLAHWLDMGCGCEIDVADEHNMINWDDKMEKTEKIRTELDNYKQMMADAFERHG
jgi:hypothetical protein